jgi:hypothetical protein
MTFDTCGKVRNLLPIMGIGRGLTCGCSLFRSNAVYFDEGEELIRSRCMDVVRIFRVMSSIFFALRILSTFTLARPFLLIASEIETINGWLFLSQP